MFLNEWGRMIEQCWLEIPHHFLHVQMDVFVIMPNHVHGIRVIPSDPTVVGAQHAVPLQGPHVEQLDKPMT
ncbi:MAG: transposase, partial [Anaerolineae bacterium]